LITSAQSDTQMQAANTPQEEKTGYEDYDEPATYQVSLGDTLRYRNGFYIIEDVNQDAKINNIPKGPNDISVGLKIRVVAADGREHTVEPIFLIKDGNTFDFNKDVTEQGLRFRFTNILPKEDKLEIMLYQKPLPEKKWIVFKAIKFPYINFFWAGTIVMTIGFIMAIYRRWKDGKQAKQKTV